MSIHLGHASTGTLSQQSAIATGSTPPPKRALEQAIGHFRARLNGNQLIDFRNTTYKDLCNHIHLVQKNQEATKNIMNLSRIQSFLEAMEQFGKTASTWADAFELLLEAYEDIGECLPLLPVYEDLFKNNPYLQEALQFMYMDILVFHEHAMHFFSQKLWKQIVKSAWKNFKTKYNGILSSLKRHKEVLDRRASLAHYQRYRDDMDSLNARLDQKIKDEKQKKLKAVSDWLAEGQQQHTDHQTFSRARLESPGTAQWILKNDFVKEWLKADLPSTPLGWLTGIPGAGKTVLASAIIDECIANREQNACLVGFFYCRSEDQANNSAVGILAGILNQLIHQYPTLLPWCYSRCMDSGETSLRSLDRAKKLFEDCCVSALFDGFSASVPPRLFLVIDGLDECSIGERTSIVNFFLELTLKCDMMEAGKLRVLLISQNFADIKKALRSSTSTRIVPRILNISVNDNKADIHSYVTRQVDAIDQKHGPLEESAKSILIACAVKNADGMFLYAKLVMEDLYNQPTQGHLVQAIAANNLPKDLQAAYARIIERIRETNEHSEWNMARKLLGWLICARRRLAWKEIQVALSINVDTQQIDYDYQRLRKHIHDICGSLIVLSGDRVSLMHSTARDYLTKITEEIHEPSIECELATLCLQYLTFPCFKVGLDDDEHELHAWALRGHFAFQDYAVAKWYHHVNAVIDSGEQLLHAGSDLYRLFGTLASAIDEFMSRYDEDDWEENIVESCRSKCEVFEAQLFYDNLVLLASHIYTFQNKRFDARHKISIRSLDAAVQRNRKLLETLPKKLSPEKLTRYRLFYDDEKRYKCNRITCMYFSEGFTDDRARKKHVNTHERPWHCDVADCIGAEGFADKKDLEKHVRSFHPDASQLAETFVSMAGQVAKSNHACSICGKTFSRGYHREDHEKSHRGERPHKCPECGRAFTRLNDMKRHRKIHDRK